jgi:hypothetical protein
MAIVAGVDFGTLSVRVSIVDSKKGTLESAVAEYPLHRKREDPDFATQSHEDHMRALAEATRGRCSPRNYRRSGGSDRARYHRLVRGPRRRGMVPLDDYYLWCDHRAKGRKPRDHGTGEPREAGSYSVVRRRVFLGVGIRQAAALAAPQSRKARAIRERLRALRHGRGHALRHHRPEAGEAQHLRHGPQVDVECRAGRPAPENFWRKSIRCSRACARNSTASTPRPTRLPERSPPMGREAGTARGHSNSCRRFRCALGRDRRGLTQATWSTWWALPPALSPIARQAQLVPGVCAAW